ncbi:MAG: hypothetical protein K6E91_04930 [Butyrivibrio sp.]|nr:hypothetical protein [Butyrivibrio sp.]
MLLNVKTDTSDNDMLLTFDWLYIHFGATDEGYDDNTPDSVFTGTWDNGTITALGPGKVTMTDFYYDNGFEYAIGSMIVPDGTTAKIFLVRP